MMTGVTRVCPFSTPHPGSTTGPGVRPGVRLRQSESPSELRLRFSSEDFSVLMTVLPVVEGGGGGRDSEDSRSLSGEAEGGGRRERLR
eukprot:3933884-Rhodomonas_salina.2